MEQVYDKKEHCYGCTVCALLCPQDAITMQPDSQGFLYPIIDNTKCVDCKKCERLCAYKKTIKKTGKQTAYAARIKDYEKRMQSRSGGAFTAVSEKYLKQNYAVYGVGFVQDLEVEHIRIENEMDLPKLKGSKYVQSALNDTFSAVQADLQNKKPVLFSGTPCQVGSLLNYLAVLNIDTSQLTTVDVVCHGTPSPLVYRDLMRMYEKKKGSKVVAFDFRPKNKDCDWASHLQALYFENAPQKPYYTNVFTKVFYAHFCLRPSCFNCNYKSLDRASDFTLADFWGIHKVFPDLYDASGCSGLVVNSPKGEMALQDLEDFEMRECEPQQVAAAQISMRENYAKPGKYDAFWQDYACKGPHKTLRKYGGYTFTNRVQNKLKHLVNKYIKR